MLATFDLPVILLLVLLVLLLVLVGLLLLRPKTASSDEGIWASENAALKRDIQAKDAELREAWKTGDRFEALAVERKRKSIGCCVKLQSVDKKWRRLASGSNH